MRPIPATLQTIYANLLQAHLDQPIFEFDGSPFTMTRRGKTYWYVNARSLGASAPRQRYLGPDTEEMRERISRMRDQREGQAHFHEHCSRMVAQLRAGGVPGLDRQTGSVLRALVRSGAFRLGGTLVGTQAFRHYDLELGVVLSAGDAGDRQLRETEDLDIASFERLSTLIEDKADPDLSQALTELGFEPILSLDPKRRPTRWKHDRSAYSIDFLTPSFEERQGPRRLAALNLWAQGLHYLDFLIKEPMPAVSLYMEGLLVQVPRPERFAVHKLIVSQKRHAGSGVKSRKDIQQARAIIWALAEDRPFELQQALKEADGRGDRWRKVLDRALEITFKSPALRHDFDRDVVWFEGAALGETHRCAISEEALDDHFGAKSGSADDQLEAVRRNRSQIEAMMRLKFRQEPSRETLLTTSDVEAFLKAGKSQP